MLYNFSSQKWEKHYTPHKPSFNNPAFLDDLAAIVLQEQAMEENTIRDVQLSRQREH